jgi:hypothetical protein
LLVAVACSLLAVRVVGCSLLVARCSFWVVDYEEWRMKNASWPTARKNSRILPSSFSTLHSEFTGVRIHVSLQL